MNNKKLKTEYTKLTMGNSVTKDASKFFKDIEGKLACNWKEWDNETRGARSGTYIDQLSDTFLSLAEENNILIRPCEGSLFPFDKEYLSDESPMRGSQKLHFNKEEQLKDYMEQIHPNKSYFIATLRKLVKKEE